ncbi:MAG TPA: Na+/H+ antiporter NhaA [Caulobacteraceae bacterium]|nr:Na+/H+ antiporter NhaA [Caulobacteraceae bacterium]
MAPGPRLGFARALAASGALTAIAAAAALALANSPETGRWTALTGQAFTIRVGGFAETLSLSGWARAGLMPLFFLLITMQLKFELSRGDLSSWRRAALPMIAAAGGVIGPLLALLALAPSEALAAWPAASATDPSLVLAALALAARRSPAGLRVLVLTIALVDDLAGLVLKAILGPAPVSEHALVGALAALALLLAVSRWRGAPFLFYAALIAIVWGFASRAGLDPALAGVACALAVPAGTRRPGQESVLRFFIDSLAPYVGFAVLPLFALASAGAPFASARLSGVGHGAAPLFLALILGKPLGVFALAAGAVLLRLARRPAGTAWLDLLGAALLGAAGMTASFYLIPVGESYGGWRLAALAASALALVAGALTLRLARARRPPLDDQLS